MCILLWGVATAGGLFIHIFRLEKTNFRQPMTTQGTWMAHGWPLGVTRDPWEAYGRL